MATQTKSETKRDLSRIKKPLKAAIDATHVPNVPRNRQPPAQKHLREVANRIVLIQNEYGKTAYDHARVMKLLGEASERLEAARREIAGA